MITISFPVFSSDRNINIFRDNCISGKSGGGGEAGGRSVKSIHTQKAKKCSGGRALCLEIGTEQPHKGMQLGCLLLFCSRKTRTASNPLASE